MKTFTPLAIVGLVALAAPAFADNGPIPMRDERQPPSIQQRTAEQRSAERPYALTGSQRRTSDGWDRDVQWVGGGRNQQTIYTR